MPALAVAHAAITFDDLGAAIEEIGPRVVIPMHSYSPRGWLQIARAEAFLSRHPQGSGTCVGAPRWN